MNGELRKKKAAKPNNSCAKRIVGTATRRGMMKKEKENQIYKIRGGEGGFGDLSKELDHEIDGSGSINGGRCNSWYYGVLKLVIWA